MKQEKRPVRRGRGKTASRRKPTYPRVTINLEGQEDLELLRFLQRKWVGEGKSEDSMSDAIRYMIRNFGQIARGSETSNDGRLPLDPKRRSELDWLAELFALSGATSTRTDVEVLSYGIDYLFQIFRREDVMERLIKSRGRLGNG